MYHPASENALEEYIELYNRATTNIDLTGWQFTKGCNFIFPSNTVIRATNYLVVAANRQAFAIRYPGVTNVVGDWAVMRVTNVVGFGITNWENVLSHTGEEIKLEDAVGQTADSVAYADEGDWAVRQRGPLDYGYQGWTWLKEPDGFGKSLELVNPTLPNEYGQNWAASAATDGTPGRVNSVYSTNTSPLIVDVTHSPILPQPTDPVAISARIIAAVSGATVRLFWRTNGSAVPAFTSAPMFDDGAHGDGVAGDGIYGALIAPQPNGFIVEFYVEAAGGSNQTNSWPRPAVDTNGALLGHVANALYQVDTGAYSGSQPIYRIIMTPAEANELQNIPCNGPGDHPSSEAQENATFISIDGQQTEVRYLIGVRRRGHGSRCANPRNYRVNFNSDHSWKNVIALNLNTQNVPGQNIGSALALKSGVAGAYSRPVQVRVNGANLALSGGGMYGSYAANEDLVAAWAENHFPSDSGGNIYRVIRDIDPPNFDYRGTDPKSYTNIYYKNSNVSENDWQDLIAMLQVMGANQTNLYTTARARQVINVEQWLLHLALMSLFGNGESGINTGNNDDYFMYRGVNDPRCILMFYDLDQILGQGSLGTGTDIFRATCCPISGDAEGTWRTMNWFMHQPDIEPIYYKTLQHLLDTTFAKTNFDALIDETLNSYVPANIINAMKTWMDARRAYVQSVITGHVPADAPVATISGEPRSPTFSRSTTLTVGGGSVVSYMFKLNNGSYSAETPVGTVISLFNLPPDSTNSVQVIGKDSSGVWQDPNAPTLSKTWIVNTNTPTVRLNEVLARNVAAVNDGGAFPDVIELYNEGPTGVEIGGLRITDNPANPGKFTFPSNTVIAAGAYLVVFANSGGTGGIHLGFNLNQDGEGVYLYERGTNNSVVDSVVFGLQLPDLSVGRFGGAGEWKLCEPTFGAANVARPVGELKALKINEWLAAGTPPFAEDFIEIYNPNPQPVDIGNCYLTDRPIGAPTMHRLPPLTFMASNSFLKLIADRNTGAGADHLSFALSADGDEIGFSDPNVSPIDSVIFGSQYPNLSRGRCPDGANAIVFMTTPTPGLPNACPAQPVPPVRIFSYNSVWKYEQSGTNLGTTWKDTNYNDSAWPSGSGALARLRNGGAIPEAVGTPLTTSITKTTFYFRAYFTWNTNLNAVALQLTHLVDDGAVFYLNGQELTRFNIPSGLVSYATLAGPQTVVDASYSPPVNVPLNSLLPGTNLLAVEVHQITAASADIVFALALDVITNTPGSAGVVINEVLANNFSIAEPDGSTPDWVELYNPSDTPVDVADGSLSDDVGNRRRWVFPPGSFVPARGYLRILFDANSASSPANTGFGLKETGDSVYLFNTPAAGGAILDSINFGIQAADFSIGRYPSGSANWVLTIPTANSSNLVATLGDPTQFKVNEWMANPASGDGWFEIYNPNAQPATLAGFWLTDDLSTPSTRMNYQIPPLSFVGAGAGAYQQFIADNKPQNGPDHVNFSLAATGESVGISRPNGTLIDGLTFGAQAAGVSQGRFPDGSTNIADFTTTPSPAESNYLPLTNVVVNEVLTHTDPPLEDAIELFNPTAADVNIGGWFLSNSKQAFQKFRIPDGITLAANGYHVFYETQFNSGASAFTFNSAHGDAAILSQADARPSLTGYRSEIKFGAAENGVSFGRYQTSVGVDFIAMSARTFGADNPTDLTQFRSGAGSPNAYPKVGPVVVNEIMYHPVSGTGTNAVENSDEEYLELRNLTANPAPLFDPAYPTNTWKLKGAVDFVFPTNTTLAAGGHILAVDFSPTFNPVALAAFRAKYGVPTNIPVFGPFSGQLNNGGDSVELYKPDAVQLAPHPDAGFVPFILVDRVQYSSLPPWPTNADGAGSSLQRINPTAYGNDPVNWQAAAPTAGRVNAGGPVDTDGDGLPDGWEIANGLNPNDPTDATRDADGDGLTNLQEYFAGTDPRNAGSNLNPTAVAANGTYFTLRFTAVAGRSYTVQYRNDLSGGAWLSLTNMSPQATTAPVDVTDPGVAGSATRFYRIITPALP